MANINSISTNSNSYTSNIYGSRNVLSGLASGMDTESMIENAVSGYQTKISQLQQQQEQLTWKQDAYRGITDQLIALSEKYTSYSSSTNLTSVSFFSRAVTTATNGTYANKISATGKATSEIEINSVSQLAKAARYSVDASALNFAEGTMGADGAAIDWGKDVTYGNLSGSITLAVGNSRVDVDFKEDDVYTTTQELVDGINKKLSDQSANVEAQLGSDGKITFRATGDAAKAGDGVYISSVSGSSVKSLLGAKAASSSAAKDRFDYNSLTVGSASALATTESMAKYLSGKTVEVTLDGTTKKVTIGDLASGATSADLAADLQKGIDKAFGAGKVTVSANDKGGVSFAVGKDSGSTLRVASSDVGEKLGLGKSGVSNYMNTGKTLESLLGANWLNKNARTAASGEVDTTARYFDKDGNELIKDGNDFYRMNSSGGILKEKGEAVTGKLDHTAYTDADGNLVRRNYDDDQYYRVNEKGEFVYDFKINDVSVGQFAADTALESVMTAINSNADAGVSVSFSNLTGEFVFTARETGAAGDITFDSPLASRLFEVNNAPAELKASDILGNINWDDDGNATLTLKAPNLDIADGRFTLNKDDTMATLIDKISNIGAAWGESNYRDMIRYDKDTGTYGLFNNAGGALDGSKFSIGQFDSDAFDIVPGTALTLSDLTEKANTSSTFTPGQDAKINVTVNGKTMDIVRSSNTIDMDGLTVNLKGTFNEGKSVAEIETGDKVTFSTSSDADKIVDTLKGFVEAYNAVMKDIHDAYATKPLSKNSKGDRYMPLSESDKSSMSESAISAYEEKAKTGLLFGDSDLSSLYDRLRNIVTASDLNLASIGITTTYSDGVTQLTIKEDELRSALESDPDKVQNIFTQSKDTGGSMDGLMARFKSVYNTYASKSYGSYGILVNKAGTKLQSLSLMSNSMQKQIDNLDKQIDSWQNKLSLKIDYYTKQFTALEKLMSTMNNQSSMLADMMGY